MSNSEKIFVSLQIIKLSSLVEAGKKIAKFAGNRDQDPKIVKSKKASMIVDGQLVPAIIVDAIDAIKQGLDVVDFWTNEPITEANAADYVVLVDAGHRFKAHMELLSEGVGYDKEFYLMYPLNTTMSIAKMLAVINTVTNLWKGKDVGNGAMMICKENLPLLIAICELTKRDYSLDAAVKWLTFQNKINKTVLADAMDGKINECLRFTTGIERGLRLLDAAKTTLDESVLKTRTISDWVIKNYDKAADENKATEIKSIETFFKSLKRSDAKLIEEAKGKRGETTKEQVIYAKLDELYNAFVAEQGKAEQAA